MVTSWSVYEDLAIGIPNFDLKRFPMSECRRLVADGEAKWALCLGGVLTLVPTDYVPKEFEFFLVEKQAGQFTKEKGGGTTYLAQI